MLNKKDDYIAQIFSVTRWLTIVAVMALYFTLPESLVFNLTMQELLYIIGFGALYSLAIQIALWKLNTYTKAKLRFVQAGVVFDYLFISSLVYFTGGVGSLFMPLYFVWLMHAALVWHFKGMLLATLLAVGSYSFIAYYFEQLFISTYLLLYGAHTIFIGLVGVFAYLLSSRKQAASIDHINYKEEAMKDYVSGLYNHRSFQNTLTKLVEKDKEFTLIKLNIDHFKQLNDTYGYETGDRVLAILGSTLDFWIEPREGYNFRYNGDEFTIILFDQKRHKIEQNIERWNNYFAEHVQMIDDLSDEYITISYGVGSLKESDDRDELLRRVDRCLHQAKASGKNKAVFDETFKQAIKS
ncbi:diguanylate cyclase (GGDEF)-like protein [Alkalibacillus filiformis]|uniref:Diguanylate cyclase (GGDEF)-like protein n=1 Tax=Alkalibacillus filiformis TaxID=200990 RepID=A0ABU0DQS5_9BACI|nr:GGDEF domain-containing protein [Alkalibacillus filiformis]MDQ0350797.1 diguanylate cyclase (GGDEF)-like protein [Alkalibacillus filiformis]